jgi:hypothetical protein
MSRYRECPACRALLTEDQLASNHGQCPYCDAPVGAHDELAGTDAAPESRWRRPLAPLHAPETLSGKLSTAFFLLFDQIALIAGLILLIKLPVNIGIELIADRNPNPIDPAKVQRLKTLADLFLGPIYTAGIITVLAHRMAGLQITFSEAAQTGLRNWGRLLAARVVSGLFVIGGLLLLIVPGLILAIRYSLLDEAVVLDGAGVRRSRARSSALVAGKELKVFLAGLVAILLVAVFFTLAVELADQAGLLEDPVIRGVVESLADVCFSFYWIVMFLFYWEAREEEEYEHATLLQAAAKDAPIDEL